MENIKNPRNQDDDSDGIPKNNHPSVDDSLNQSRSYLCSFCIRGFSNAQALGGHMNIHRRDRAKLRQQLMEEDDVVAESDSTVSLDLNEQQEEKEKEEEKSMACDEDHDQDISHGQKLGFWGQENKPNITDHGKVMDVIIDGSSSSHPIEELDLELRLGQSAMEKKKT